MTDFLLDFMLNNGGNEFLESVVMISVVVIGVLVSWLLCSQLFEVLKDESKR